MQRGIFILPYNIIDINHEDVFDVETRDDLGTKIQNDLMDLIFDDDVRCQTSLIVAAKKAKSPSKAKKATNRTGTCGLKR